MGTVIISKTRMSGVKVCVGGFDTDSGRNVRLLTSFGSNQNKDTPFQIGQIWNLVYKQRPNCHSPHIEDILIISWQYVGNQNNLKDFIRSNCSIIRGSLSKTFENKLVFTIAGSAFIAHSSGIPNGSVCFWRPDSNLIRNDYGNKTRYDYIKGSHRRHITFVGFQGPVSIIRQDSIVRLSLARWWCPKDSSPEEEEKCFLQLSGYFE
jgi:hypothetical protein